MVQQEIFTHLHRPPQHPMASIISAVFVFVTVVSAGVGDGWMQGSGFFFGSL